MKDGLGDYQHLWNDDNATRITSRQTRAHNLWRALGVVVFVCLILGVGYAAGSTRYVRTLWLSKPKITYCGHTSSEARALGCVLEPMMYGWMPPQCQYSEISSYNDFMKWPWYADQNMSQPLSEEQVWEGKSTMLWTDRPGFHTEHCLFLYRKLMYGIEKKVRWLDKKTLSSEHAYHCVGHLGEAFEEGEIATNYAELGIYTCEQTIW